LVYPWQLISVTSYVVLHQATEDHRLSVHYLKNGFHFSGLHFGYGIDNICCRERWIRIVNESKNSRDAGAHSERDAPVLMDLRCYPHHDAYSNCFCGRIERCNG